MGELIGPDGAKREPSVLAPTRLLPSLRNASWNQQPETKQLSNAQKIDIKRARLRVEILKRGSDPTSKFELFQRLNTGGVTLSEQEVRNCSIIMIDPTFYHWLLELTEINSFRVTTNITKKAQRKRFDIELVLRVLAMRNQPYQAGLDVHQCLDQASMMFATKADFPRQREAGEFTEIFEIAQRALGKNAFQRWNGNRFSGKFLLSVFEVITTGISKNINAFRQMNIQECNDFLLEKSKGTLEGGTFLGSIQVLE
jgi:hypothetical protein